MTQPISAPLCMICDEPIFSGRSKRFCEKDHYGNCLECGKEYLVKKVGTPPKVCSNSCAAKSRLKSKKERTCHLCGDSFIGAGNAKFCPKIHTRSCVNCSKEFPILNTSKIKDCCSWECSIAQSKTTKSCKRCGAGFEGTAQEVYCAGPHYESCETCGKQIVDKTAKKKSRFCSTSCASRNPNRSYELNCELCGEKFEAKTSRAKYCSRDHYKSCLKCEKEFLILNVHLIPDTCSPTCAALLVDFNDRNDKTSATLLERYGVSNSYQIPQVVENMLASGTSRISKLNIRWREELESLSSLPIELEKAFKRGAYADLRYEDIFVDLNPSISHSSSHPFLHLIGRCSQDGCTCTAKDPLYHQKRFLAAESEGKTLLQHFDWQDEAIFKSIILSKLHANQRRVAAKKCEVREVSQRDANRFFKENHLLGAASGQSFCVGLFFGGELVHCHSFGPARLNRSFQWEAIRSCSKMGWQVQGGFSKADSLFFKSQKPESVVSYADLAIGNGSTEANNPGWELISTNRPSATWVYLGSLEQLGPKQPLFVKEASARRLSADRLLGLAIGEKYPSHHGDGRVFSNSDVLQAEGYVQVFDAGTRTFGWRGEESHGA